MKRGLTSHIPVLDVAKSCEMGFNTSRRLLFGVISHTNTQTHTDAHTLTHMHTHKQRCTRLAFNYQMSVHARLSLGILITYTESLKIRAVHRLNAPIVSATF